MSNDARLFFETWVARTFAADLPWSDHFPTPLAALTELRAAATLAGVAEEDLRAAVGDPLTALVGAMLDAPDPDPTRFDGAPDLTEARTAAAAMELALSYGEGLRDTWGGDRTITASLVLRYLARQGFGLRAIATDTPARRGRRAGMADRPASVPPTDWTQ